MLKREYEEKMKKLSDKIIEVELLGLDENPDHEEIEQIIGIST